MQVLATELMRLAHHVAGGPEAGALAAALRAALMVVDRDNRTDLTPLIVDLAGRLIMLADSAEWIAERAQLMTPPHAR